MKFYVSTPIYYVNAKPHIGHAYTTLAADIISRWRLMRGDDVFFLTGTDEHGAKIEKAAVENGKEPKVFADEVSEEFKRAWGELGILYSDFIRTTEPRHESGVARFMEILKKNSALYEADYKGLYCTGCENFITEKELVGGKCPNHKKAPDKISERNWFFKLSDYTNEIKELIERDELKIRPDFARRETLGLIEQGLEDFSVSRESVWWGIPLPWDKKQTIYVWIDALLNYITASEWNKCKAPWPADLHIIGKDIIKFHCVYWPAMLLAAGFELPRQIFAHGYFTIDGQKMSKSLGNVIDPIELVSSFGKDGARYLIISQFPFGQDGDVKAEFFAEQYNASLANGLGNLVSRVSSAFLRTNSKLSKCNDKCEVGHVWSGIEKHYENFAIEEVLKEVWKLIQSSDKIVEQEKIWSLKAGQKEASKIFYLLFENIRHISFMVKPFLPDVSEKIFDILGISCEGKKFFKEASVWGALPEGVRVKKCVPLFPRK